MNRDDLLVRNFKGHKSLLTKFDLEEQNMDIKYTEDSSNLERFCPSKLITCLLLTYIC